VLFRLENTYIELLSPDGDGLHGRALADWLEAQGEGLIGLAFGTDDADTCRNFFIERGLEPEAIEKGLGRDVESGAFREWRRIPLPGWGLGLLRLVQPKNKRASARAIRCASV